MIQKFIWNHMEQKYELCQKFPEDDFSAIKYISQTMFSQATYAKLRHLGVDVRSAAKITTSLFFKLKRSRKKPLEKS